MSTGSGRRRGDFQGAASAQPISLRGGNFNYQHPLNPLTAAIPVRRAVSDRLPGISELFASPVFQRRHPPPEYFNFPSHGDASPRNQKVMEFVSNVCREEGGGGGGQGA